MIKANSQLVLRPFKTYKNEPEKNVDFLVSGGEQGRKLYFQAADHNRDAATKKTAVGFFNLCILTNQELKPGDTVTVKSIVGVKVFYMKRTILITILEPGEKKVNSKPVDGFDVSEVDF